MPQVIWEAHNSETLLPYERELNNILYPMKIPGTVGTVCSTATVFPVVRPLPGYDLMHVGVFPTIPFSYLNH